MKAIGEVLQLYELASTPQIVHSVAHQ